MYKAEASRNQTSLQSSAGQKGIALEPPHGERLAQFAAMANGSAAAAAQRRLTAAVDASPYLAAQRRQMESIAPDIVPGGTIGNSGQFEALQRADAGKRENRTGLPDGLKSGVESLSGMSMDGVRVHYNSSQPAQLNALAYTRETDIHVAPGQERHLAHEAWHVVQQAQGRVAPTMQMKDGVPVNDDAALEREADAMGAQAVQARTTGKRVEIPGTAISGGVVQRLLYPFKRPAAPNGDQTAIMADAATIEDLTQDAYTNTWDRLVAATRPNMPEELSQDQFPGVTDGHFTHFATTMQGGDNALKAAAAGYVIEDQVTFSAGLPASAAAQQVVGNARPDFVITRNGDHGIVDITTMNERGHVLEKDFNKGNFCYVAESLYSSINFNALNGVAPALGPGAVAAVAAAARERANAFVGSSLYQIRQKIVLFREGIMNGDNAFVEASDPVRDAINAGPPWDIAAMDQSIADMNGLLPDADFHQPTMTDIVATARAHYLVAGDPPY